jgi:hypothetical protein
MSSINDLYGKFLGIKTAIQNKGGIVTVANTNPSPDELITGIGTITGMHVVSEMPTASASTVGAMYKFIGATDDDYEYGKYYMTLQSGSTYSWILVNERDIPTSGNAMLIAYVIKSDGTPLASKSVVITNTSTSVSETLTTDRYGKIFKEVVAGTYSIAISDAVSGYTTPTALSVTVAANQVDYSYLIYVQSVSATFSENSWETISEVSALIASGNMTAADVLSNYGWSIGDTKTETLTTGETITLRIIGFNHDTLSSDHTSKAGITMQIVDCLVTRYPMNATNTNAGGYGASVMRTTTLPTIKATLSSALQNVIKLVDKKAANGGSANYSATETLSDDLFLLAEKEVFGTVTYAQDGANEGEQYAWYAANNTANDRIKKFDSDANGEPETATSWWECSSSYNGANYFCIVSSGGIASNSIANNSRGVAFGFCI